MLKKWVRFFVAATVATAVYVFMLYLLQDKLLFVPDVAYITPQQAELTEFEERPMTMPDGNKVMSWYVQGQKDKPLILFFHGNARQVASFAPEMRPYIKEGYSVLMPEYRGFAKSKGYLNQENMYADAERWFDYAKNELRHQHIAVMGYSMGTAPASRLSATRKADAVVLLAPFFSLKQEVADKMVPFATKVLTRNLPSYSFIAQYKGPLLIMHGQSDLLISQKHGRSLYKISPSKDKELVLPSGVNHFELFFGGKSQATVLNWLARVFGIE